MTHACAILGLEDVEVLAARAEDAGRDPRLRDSFDAATARALASLPVVVELCLPFVRPGGRLLAMKTAGAEEAAGALPAITALNAELLDVTPAPSTARSLGTVAVIRKLGPTPDAYPRRAGVPLRKPLGM